MAYLYEEGTDLAATSEHRAHADARKPAAQRRLSLAEVFERNLDPRWEWLVVGGFIRPGWPKTTTL